MKPPNRKIAPQKVRPPSACPEQPEPSPGALRHVPSAHRSIVASEAVTQWLSLDLSREETETSAIPMRKLPWAHARRRIIANLINEGEVQWEAWRNQKMYGISIRTKEDFVQALAKDSAAAQPLLVQWSQVNEELREATRQPLARISPLSARTIWR